MAKAKKPKKEKKEKILRSKGYVISIKLQSPHRMGATAYKSILNYLFQNKIRKSTGFGSDMILIRTQFEKEIDGNTVIYGRFAKYTKLDGNDWIDEEELSYSKVDTPANKNPNPKELSYVFVPACHRFFIEKSTNVSLNAVANYLKEAIKEFITADEFFYVDIELSKGVYKEIFTANSVEWIEVGISYTNDGTGSAAAEIVDKQFKSAKIGNALMKFKADASKSIDLTEQFVSGVVELSRTNGFVKARIKNKRYKTINTKDHPEEVIISRPEHISWENSVAEDLIKREGEAANKDIKNDGTGDKPDGK
jgi:hypothetical protein